MKKELAKLELQKFLLSDAAEIVAARTKAILIHHTKDINAAGDEIEIAVRNVLERKLPNNYYIGQGHIVDENLTTSPQLDIILSDAEKITSLFKSQNKTEYFTYESVYGFGEIKSTYYKSSNYIQSFVETTEKIHLGLKREKTPKNHLAEGVTLGSGFSTNINSPYRNPMMSFMLFVDSGDFKIEDVRDLYVNTDVEYLPNVVCLLNKGCIVNAQIVDGKELGSLNPTPIFLTDTKKVSSKWVFIPFGDDENRIGSNFGILYYLIVNHLSSTILLKPDLLKYMKHMFNYGEGKIIT